MRDYVEISSTPAEEQCASVGDENYSAMAHQECRAFICQLRRQFGKEPGTARLVIGSNPHDLGTYYEVRCTFEDSDEVGMAYGFGLDGPPKQHKFVYKTPGLIVSTGFEYEIKDVKLP